MLHGPTEQRYQVNFTPHSLHISSTHLATIGSRIVTNFRRILGAKDRGPTIVSYEHMTIIPSEAQTSLLVHRPIQPHHACKLPECGPPDAVPCHARDRLNALPVAHKGPRQALCGFDSICMYRARSNDKISFSETATSPNAERGYGRKKSCRKGKRRRPGGRQGEEPKRRSIDAIWVGKIVNLLLDELENGPEDGVGEGGAENGDGEPYGVFPLARRLGRTQNAKGITRTAELGAISIVDLRDRHRLPFCCFQQVPLVVILDEIEVVRLDKFVSLSISKENRDIRRPS